MTLFDVIALLILLVSGVIGLVRGAVREVVTVFAFVLAVLIALFSLRITGPLARHMIEPAWAANTAAVLVVIVVAYVLIRMIGAGISRQVRDIETLGVLDRVGGVAFGIIRGLVVLGVFQLVFSAATPADRMPAWISRATLYPLAATCAKALRKLAPEGSAVAGRLGPHLEKAVRDGARDAPQGDPNDGGVPGPTTEKPG